MISGGTPPYNASASPRQRHQPDIQSQNNPPSGSFSNTPVVTRSGGIFRIGNLTQTVTVSFIDSSNAEEDADPDDHLFGNRRTAAVSAQSSHYSCIDLRRTDVELHHLRRHAALYRRASESRTRARSRRPRCRPPAADSP